MKKGFAISYSNSVFYDPVFLFVVSFADHFLLFTDQTTQHIISTKCQGYTTDLIACHWHYTSLCILVIQSNTVPNVNRKKKEKKKTKKEIALWEKDGENWEEKNKHFWQKSSSLYSTSNEAVRKYKIRLQITRQLNLKRHLISYHLQIFPFSVTTKSFTYLQKYKQIHVSVKAWTFCKIFLYVSPGVAVVFIYINL